jgi:YebC/PmpR family DNA-binding regulatory protein
MSGHSKWSQIKRQKGAADVKRSANFSKLTNAIIVAAKNGGDPNTNFTLKMAVEKAKSENMPKDNIERAIKRGSGEGGGVAIEEAIYEIIAPHGVGIIVTVLTDNKNRTISEIKNIINRNGAKLANSGAVMYQFQKMGKILIDPAGKSIEDIELMTIDAGAEDFSEHDDLVAVYTKPNELEKAKKALEEQDLNIKEAQISYEPQNIIHIKGSDAEQIIKLIETIDSLDDVNEVFANFDINDDKV